MFLFLQSQSALRRRENDPSLTVANEMEVLAGGGENLLARERKAKRIKTQARQINIHMGDHPAVFPIELPTRIIASLLEEEDGIVIDPFCGTGTTLVAAKLLGKKYIGIDISEKYVEYARRRLERAEEERVRVLRELSLHKILGQLIRNLPYNT
jgi:DNA modification methylase